MTGERFVRVAWEKRPLFLVLIVCFIAVGIGVRHFVSADKSSSKVHSPPVRSAPPAQKPPTVQVIDLYFGFSGFEPEDIPDAKPGVAVVTLHDLRGERRPTTFRLTAPDGKQTALAAASGAATSAEVELAPGVLVVSDESGGKPAQCRITVVKD
jgi:hypothetical protein